MLKDSTVECLVCCGYRVAPLAAVPYARAVNDEVASASKVYNNYNMNAISLHRITSTLTRYVDPKPSTYTVRQRLAPLYSSRAYGVRIETFVCISYSSLFVNIVTSLSSFGCSLTPHTRF
ncbi:hypothetical protein QTP88_005170 [Uroleucon formosanum]